MGDAVGFGVGYGVGCGEGRCVDRVRIGRGVEGVEVGIVVGENVGLEVGFGDCGSMVGDRVEIGLAVGMGEGAVEVGPGEGANVERKRYVSGFVKPSLGVGEVVAGMSVLVIELVRLTEGFVVAGGLLAEVNDVRIVVSDSGF